VVSKRALRWQEGQTSTGDTPPEDEDLTCPLCGRPMVPGPTVDEHHLVPRSLGGREKQRLHKVCHQKIHQALKPREIARHYTTWEALRDQPEIATFIDWVRKRPPEFLG
jgi:5-methylcytosine-specific restriction endonuclease McrA